MLAEDAATASPDELARLLAEQQQPRQAVPFNPVHFDMYVGYYALRTTAVFKISRNGDNFFVQLTGQDPVAVYPESETKFFATEVSSSYVLGLSHPFIARFILMSKAEIDITRI